MTSRSDYRRVGAPGRRPRTGLRHCRAVSVGGGFSGRHRLSRSSATATASARKVFHDRVTVMCEERRSDRRTVQQAGYPPLCCRYWLISFCFYLSGSAT